MSVEAKKVEEKSVFDCLCIDHLAIPGSIDVWDFNLTVTDLSLNLSVRLLLFFPFELWLIIGSVNGNDIISTHLESEIYNSDGNIGYLTSRSVTYTLFRSLRVSS